MTVAMPWVKIYTEILDEPKISELSDDLKWRYVQMIVFAGECDTDGYLVSGHKVLTPERIAWRLRMDKAQLEKDLDALREAGVVADEDGGVVCVRNFAQRQGRSQKDKRAEWRERQNKHRQNKAKGGTAPTAPPEPDIPPDPSLLTSPPENNPNVTRESRVTHEKGEVESHGVEKRREEERRDSAAEPAQEHSSHNTSVADATKPEAEAEPSVTRTLAPQTDKTRAGNFANLIFERAMKAKENPALAQVRKWGLAERIEGVCIDYVELAKDTPVVESDKGKWAKGAKDVLELFRQNARAYSRAWMEQAVKTATFTHTHPMALDTAFRELFKKGWKPANAPADDGTVHAGWQQNDKGEMVEVRKRVVAHA